MIHFGLILDKHKYYLIISTWLISFFFLLLPSTLILLEYDEVWKGKNYLNINNLQFSSPPTRGGFFMEIKYTDICSALGIDLLAPVRVIERGNVDKWRECEGQRTIALLIVQAYIGIATHYGISEDDAIKNTLDKDKRLGLKHRQNITNFIDTIRRISSSLVQGELPSIISLSALGLLRIIPARNLREAEMRFDTIKIALKDPTCQKLFTRDPTLFQDRVFLTRENPLFCRESSVSDRLRVLSSKWV